MRVKDLVKSLGELGLDNPIDNQILYSLTEDNKPVGNIVSWTYSDEELIGHAQPVLQDEYEYLGCLRDFLNIVEEYNVPGDTEIFIDVPVYGGLQHLTNWSYDIEKRIFSSDVYWRSLN
ncbi:hypothetical protein [Methanobrevibacter sp.]|uniref:hypothetical protein n=1 Tax=Methanobrevibacter sp. TaxID=66852 RepID=UPI00386496BC